MEKTKIRIYQCGGFYSFRNDKAQRLMNVTSVAGILRVLFIEWMLEKDSEYRYIHTPAEVEAAQNRLKKYYE